MSDHDQMTNGIVSHSHEPGAIRQRISGVGQASYVGDAVLGALDGSVTTVAIIAGALGAQLSGSTIVVLGMANLLADGLSMATGNFQRAKSDLSYASLVERTESHHIDHWPEGEREEIYQIYRNKGFEGELLDQIIEVITSDRRRWIETMMQEEWGIGTASQRPVRVAMITLIAFVLVGAVPLLPFFWQSMLTTQVTGIVSVVLTSMVLVAIGCWRAKLFGENILRGGLGTLLAGGSAAILAFSVAHWLRDLL